MLPKIAIIYLSYNRKQYLPEVLDALRSQDYPRDRMEFVFVDNASTDGAREYLEKVDDITFFPNKDNPGFAGGNNIGMEYALNSGADYIFLHNDDLKLHPDAIKEAVALAESDPSIGSVQSTMRIWKRPEELNSTGGMVHFLGFGYARDNGERLDETHREDGEEIAYATGAAVLYRSTVLRQVGLLDTFFFMYHEDLELGWRIRLNGFKNVLSTKSFAFHDYQFKRSIKKFFWMEYHRWLVHLSHLKLGSLLLIVPFMILLEIPLLFFAVRGGWVKEKLKVYGHLLLPKSWFYVLKKRRESSVIRHVSDRKIVKIFTPKIDHQETQNVIVEKIGNPILTVVWFVLKRLIVW